MKRKNHSTSYFAFTQAFLLIMSLFAFTFILSESVLVSGQAGVGTPEAQLEKIGEELKETKEEVEALLAGAPPAAVVPVAVSIASGSVNIVSGGTTTLVGKALTGPVGIGSELVEDVNMYVQSANKNLIKGFDVNTLNPIELTPGVGNVFNLDDLGSGVKSSFDPLVGASPDALEKMGLSSVTALNDGGFEITKVGGATSTYDSGGKLLSTTAAPEDVIFGFGGTLGHLIEGVVFATAIIGAIQLFGPMFGASQDTIDALSISAAVGVAAYEAAEIAEYVLFEGSAFELGSIGIGLGVAVVVFLFLYSEDEEKRVVFECRPWQAATGGSDCEKCNDGDLPCSEYQCRSLGQACEIVNKGTIEEKCVWVNRQDVNPPTIEPLKSALLNDYLYIPDNTIAPPDRGVKIIFENSRDNCIPAFTPLQFGVELNEPAACKIDTLRKQSFDEMRIFMDSGILDYNHSFALSLPSVESLESRNITVENDGEFSMFVRCQDANGNSNIATFVFSYCIDEGPDTTPPLIVSTNILNNVPIAFNQSSIDLEVYVNEPSECKWSHNDRDFDSMEETMSCTSNVFNFNAQALYKCETTLTGLNDGVDNDFFFRCKDKPNSPESDRNTNVESFKFTLIGTQPLVIDSVTPNDTLIKDSTDTVKVTIKVRTSAGFDEGDSICYYSDTENENDFIQFFETESFQHSQDLFLLGGSYEYFIKCVDLGGNTDRETINFEVETDFSSPLVVRAYKEENFLKLITNEDAECVYSTFGCNYEFDEGTTMTVVNGTNHFTSWGTESNLYVKCQDDFGNQPLPNQCSISVRIHDF